MIEEGLGVRAGVDGPRGVDPRRMEDGRSDTTAVLEVKDLHVGFPAKGGEKQIVHGLSYDIRRGETLGVVGESGCGKTMTSLALLGLVPGNGRASGRILLEGNDLLLQTPGEWRALRGRDVAMIFQEPLSAMNPVMKIGAQIAEVLTAHAGLSRRAAGDRAVELIDSVGIPSPRQRALDYPHQLSGGQRQRAMIAMALACRPKLLVADEPTTALDVTIQAQILELILELQEENGMAVQFISHNLAVVSEIAHRILVMYAGRGIEMAPAESLFVAPMHPYTKGLIATLPDPDVRAERLHEIPGSIRALPEGGCRFAPRCALASDVCRVQEPPLREVLPDHFVACVKAGQ